MSPAKTYNFNQESSIYSTWEETTSQNKGALTETPPPFFRIEEKNSQTTTLEVLGAIPKARLSAEFHIIENFAYPKCGWYLHRGEAFPKNIFIKRDGEIFDKKSLIDEFYVEGPQNITEEQWMTRMMIQRQTKNIEKQLSAFLTRKQ